MSMHLSVFIQQQHGPQAAEKVTSKAHACGVRRKCRYKHAYLFGFKKQVPIRSLCRLSEMCRSHALCPHWLLKAARGRRRERRSAGLKDLCQKGKTKVYSVSETASACQPRWRKTVNKPGGTTTPEQQVAHWLRTSPMTGRPQQNLCVSKFF